MNTNSYILKTKEEGVKVLTIDDLKSKKFSLKVLLDGKLETPSSTDSLSFKTTPSDIVIATTIH